MAERVTLLSGGVGGAKLALGCYGVVRDPALLTVVVNTGDDIDLFGLRICPDLDIVLYTLAGLVNPETGWGRAGDTFRAIRQAERLGATGWFNLGDLDLGLHLFRTEQLRGGASLTGVTRRLAAELKVRCTVLPMCEEPVPTRVATREGELHLQEYLVRRRAEPVVTGLRQAGIKKARPAPGVLEALARSDLVIIAPSNPLISIGPILAVPGVREALAASRALRVAVCPVVGGKSLKGPTDRMLTQLGHEVSPAGVAALYRDVLDVFVIDEQDRSQAGAVERLGVACRVLPTVMADRADKQRLALDLLALREQR